MYYEFYVDQFFVEQFLTDSLLLFLTAVFCRKCVRLWRLLAGGAVGAFSMTGLVCTGWPGLWPLGLVAAGLTAFGRGNWRENGKNQICLLFVTFCFGGVLEALMELTGLPLFAGSAGAALLIWTGISGWHRKQQPESSRTTVTLFWDGNVLELEGLIDTGNHLTEPLTGKPVSVLSAEAAEKLLGKDWERRRGFCLIPYHSIGRETGWMRAVVVDEMQVAGEDGKVRIVLKKPVLAISEGYLSRKEQYQILLHPMHGRGYSQIERTEMPDRQQPDRTDRNTG